MQQAFPHARRVCVAILLMKIVCSYARAQEGITFQAEEAPVTVTRGEWNSLLERLDQTEAELRGLKNESEAGIETVTAPDAMFECCPSAPPKESPAFPVIKLSGFFHLDAGYFGQDAASMATLGDIQDGVGFRRARLQALGSVAEFTNYSIELDFGIAGRPSLVDIWVEQTDLPFFGAVRIGQFRHPTTMDSLTPIRQLTFLERSAPFQALDPFRRPGIMAYNKTEDERTTWQYSVFKAGGFENAPIGDTRFGTDIGDNGGYGFAARGTHLLWYDEPADGRYLAHVGANFSYGDTTGNGTPNSEFYQARAIPEFFVGDPAGPFVAPVATPFFVDTGRLAADSYTFSGVEFAAQWGSLHLQSEYMFTGVNQTFADDPFYHGGYAQVGYFLTGEHRSYNRTFGAFDKVTPHEEFFAVPRGGVCGWGAWEVAGRVSYLDLNDPNAIPMPGFPSRPGRLTNTTLGVNWYWNAYAKIQFNWIHAFLDSAAGGDSDTDIFATRAQLEF